MMAPAAPAREAWKPVARGRERELQDTCAAGAHSASCRGACTVSSAVCSRGILPVGCPCVLRRSRGKAMEMSHSGLVRLPAKEVGVEAPREFESPHLRHSESPGAQQRAGASSLPEHSLRPPPQLPDGLPDSRAGPTFRAFASGRSGCLCVFRRGSGIA